MNIWKNFEFTRFFTSFTIGNIGDWFDIFALQIIFVHEWHASPVILGTLILFYFLPSIVLSPIAGIWADRISKRNLMLYTDLIAAFLTIGLYLSGSVSEVLILLFIRSSVVSFNTPAQQAYIKHVVTDEQLLTASSYTTIVFEMCKVAGPMLGALVLLYTSARSCLAINAFSFVLSAFVLATLPKDKIAKEDGEESPAPWVKDALTGVKVIWNNSLLRTVVTVVILWFYCSLVRQAQLAIFLHHVLPYKKEPLGLFMGLDGLGAVTSSMLLSRKKEITNYAAYFFIGFILLGIGIFGVGIYHAAWPHVVLYASAVVIGLGTGVVLVAYGYIVKRETPKKQIGRVSGASSALQNAALAAGALSSGFLVLQFGIREVYLALAAIIIALAFCSFFFINRAVKPGHS